MRFFRTSYMISCILSFDTQPAIQNCAYPSKNALAPLFNRQHWQFICAPFFIHQRMLHLTLWSNLIDSTLIYGFWLQRGRGAEAEAELERLFGGLHVKYSMAELSKSERGDDADAVKFSELISPRNFGGKNVNLFQIISHCTNMFPSKRLLLYFSICSGFHWIYPFCFTTVIWHKCCILFLVNCL